MVGTTAVTSHQLLSKCSPTDTNYSLTLYDYMHVGPVGSGAVLRYAGVVGRVIGCGVGDSDDHFLWNDQLILHLSRGGLLKDIDSGVVLGAIHMVQGRNQHT